MQAIQPVTDNKGWVPTFKLKPVLKSKPLTITWNKLPLDFELPDDPVDNIAQPLLADALREALEQADLISSPTQLIATNFGIGVTVNGEFVIKAPDWVYVPEVIPLPKSQDRKSYTPNKEGALPEIVMEFLSDKDGREYSKKATPLYGKWFFYEQILKVPLYAIFNPEKGTLEVYQLKSNRYQRQKPDKKGRYWIEALEVFLGVWQGTKLGNSRTGYWLRWWDREGNLLLWGKEALEKAEAEKRAALEKAEVEKQAALKQADRSAQQAKKAEKAKKEALEKAKKAEAEKRAALEKADRALQQAETTNTLRIAKQMLEANIDIALIMQVTGLDKASIEDLQK